ncbi:hypothetical protein [Flavobacterium sp. GT3P67]|uniref:hypothetical protein n=1 Tax=Flavobacterium sp. GT3P67 TaxID=2541722 RepID=UPI001052B1A3|nr:hypothetical protein [Flavobacterium sp. GT3P67]TDE54815.1 hypothetical protein E0H99_00460 [Flavobacterium sp. GT3P67]
MKKNYFSKKVLHACLLFFMIITTNVFAQVGIGTITPHASSVLDVSSTTQGMLTPRMTTVQRTAIVSPTDGLIVYDTDLKSFYHYNITTALWNRLSSEANGRLKFKRIKSTDVLATVLAAEKAAGGNTKYLLDTGTLYEINGQVVVDLPIELNNAYVAGLDSGEDKLVKASGDLFTGTTGGSIRVLTLVSGGNVFNLTGNGTSSLVFRDCIVANSANVGLVKNFDLVFVSIVQYFGNANGIIYEDVNRLLISNAGWFGGSAPLANSGTYEKLVGTFSLVTKQGGFSEVTGTSVGFDVSLNPIITGDAVMESVVFTGALSGAGVYVKAYTVGGYAGYNFNNNWSVRCPGIPTEIDASAAGNIYDNNNLSATTTTATTINTGYKVGTNVTNNANLFRAASTVSGRLKYTGKKPRSFQVITSVSFQVAPANLGSNTNYVFYFAKIGANGTTVTPLPETETFIDTNSGFTQSFPISGNVFLNKDESIELHLKRISTGTTTKLDTYSFNLSIK